MKMGEFTSINQILSHQARSFPQKTAFSLLTFQGPFETNEDRLTFGELDRRARAVAELLRNNVPRGKPVILLYPSDLNYIVAFFGCLYANVIAVPSYPPLTAIMSKNLKSIIADSQAETVLTSQALYPLLKSQMDGSAYGHLRWLTTDTLSESHGESTIDTSTSEASLVYLQYTSGSTSSPKGVCLTHGNLLHNLGLINRLTETTPEDKGAFWLPLYHDLGLIGGLLHTVYVGGSTYVFSPLDFLRNPACWLQVISERRITVSGGPNFAYELCTKKVTDEQIRDLDLSTWKVAANGAEPIQHGTMERFSRRFEQCGFRREAFLPCYGLAESSLLVSGTERHARPKVVAFDEDELKNNKVVRASSSEDTSPLRVSSGPIAGDTRVRIVNPHTLKTCRPGEVGEIWVQSRSVAEGYYNRDEESERTFRARCLDDDEGCYLRTGDLGFIFEGELFITGRTKDLIIIRGRNYYPSDIEQAIAMSHPAIRAGGSAAFSVEDPVQEKLVVIQELKRSHQNADKSEVCRAIRKAVMTQFTLKTHDIALVRQGTILKTSSGKLRRNANRMSYLSGTLERL